MKLINKKAISALLLITFLFQNVSWADPDFARNFKALSREDLAPKLLLEEGGVQMQELMSLAYIGKHFFFENIRVSRLAEYIRELPLLTAEVRDKLDFDNAEFDGKTLKFGYQGTEKKYTVSLKKGTNRGEPVIKKGVVEVEGIVIEFTAPAQDGVRQEENTDKQDDLTLSAEGDIAIHEGPKEEVKGWGPIAWFKRWRREKITGRPLNGNMGVNDVIRKAREEEKVLPSPDFVAIIDELDSTPGGRAIADSIRKNNYHLYVYKLGKKYFKGGVSTHSGIRTGSIHITDMEYERLKGLGIRHLAARVAHEVTEIDAWRKKADELAEGLGEVKGIYNGDWSNGVRKWIKDDFAENGGRVVKPLYASFHKKGVEEESLLLIEDLISVYLKFFPEKKDPLKAYEGLLHVTGRFLENGDLYDIALDPYYSEKAEELKQKALRASGEAYEREYRLAVPVISAIMHFNTPTERKLFVNILHSRAKLGYIKAKEKKDITDTNYLDRETYVFNRVKDIRDYLKEVIINIDSRTRAEITEWLEKKEEAVSFFSHQAKGPISECIYEVKRLLSDRSKWDLAYDGDPTDLVIAAGQDTLVFGEDPNGEAAMEEPISALGQIRSVKLSKLLKPQEKPFSHVKEVDDIITNLSAQKNWYYQDISRRSTTAKRGALSDTGTSFNQIRRIKSDKSFQERISRSISSMRYYLLNHPGKIFGQSRISRIFVGSPTGYFDVEEKASRTSIYCRYWSLSTERSRPRTISG